MRPRTYTLATAGSKLTGPPEGYGRKKELQVKHWLVSARPAEEAGAPDITAEPSVYPNQSLDDVYKQLRDSTDNLHTALRACDQSSRAEGGPAADRQTEACPAEDTPAATVQPATTVCPPALSCSHEPAATARQPPASSPSPSPSTTLSIAPTGLREDVAADARSRSSQPVHNPPAVNLVVAVSKQQLVQPLSAAAACVCQVLEAAEATEPTDEHLVADHSVEVQDLQDKLQQLTQEHKEYVSKTTAELAAAYSAAKASKSAAAAQANESEQMITALRQQLAAAQADAAAARSEGIQAKQQAKRLLMEKEDVAAEQIEQLQQLQEQMQRVTNQMVQSSDKHQQTEKKLQQQLQEAKQQILDSRRELELWHSNSAVKESQLSAQLQAMKHELAGRQQRHTAQQEEAEQLQQVCQQLQAAKKAAEIAEDKALQLAAERARLFEALMLEVQRGPANPQRCGSAATISKPTQRATYAPAVPSETANKANQGQQQQQHHRVISAIETSDSGNIKPVSAVSANADAASETLDASRSMQQTAQQRRQLQKGIAADKRALADLATAQRRARAAAQLQESSMVQQMLASAPEVLRILGLAFRAYVLLTPAHTDSSSNNSSTAPWLQQLTCSYHLYLDNTTLAHGHNQADLSANSLGLSAAILRASGALLLALPNESAVQGIVVDNSDSKGWNSGSSLHVGSAGLGLLQEAVRLGVPVMFVGKKDPIQQKKLLEAAGSAGWSQQEQHSLVRHLDSHFVSCPDIAAEPTATLEQLQQILGFTDLQLSLLPQTALRKVKTATASQGGIANLQCLNCTALTHITLDLAAMAVAATKELQQQKQQANFGSNAQRIADVAMEQVLGIVCKLAADNSTLRVLKLENVSLAGAEAVAAAVIRGRGMQTGGESSNKPLQRTVSAAANRQLSLIGINGLLVPVSAVPVSMHHDGMLCPTADCEHTEGGMQQAHGLAELNLCSCSLAAQLSTQTSKTASSTQQQQLQVAVLLTSEQAAFLAVLLPHCSNIVRLQLPLLAPDVNEDFSAKLAEAVMKLPKLQEFNGIQLDLKAAFVVNDNSKQHREAAATSSADRQKQCDVQAAVGATTGAVLDLAGKQLGPVGAALVARSLQQNSLELSAQLACSRLTVNMTGCNIGSYGACHVAASLVKLYSSPRYSSTNSSCTSLTTAVSSSAAGHLAALHVSGNQLGASGLRQLLSALDSAASDSSPSILEHLQVLGLSHNLLRAEGCVVLAEHLTKLQGLRALDLSGNELSAAAAQALFKALSRNADVLPKLRVLQLGSNKIGDAGATALAAVLPNLRQLQQLHLQENYSIGCEGVRAIAAALSLTPQLTYLDLAKNNLGPQAGRLLATGLQVNAAAAAAAAAAEGTANLFVGLKQLDLEWCKLKTEGVVHLASALAITTATKPDNSNSATRASSSSGSSRWSNSGSSVKLHSCLQKLGLSRNGAGDKGVYALAEALATNRSLTHLDLRSNAIGLTGCRALSGLLQGHNSTLQVLQLAGNMEGSDEHEAPVLQALEELAAADRSSLKSSAV